MKTIFEQSRPGRKAFDIQDDQFEETSLPEELLRSSDAQLPEVSEIDLMRHYMALSRRNAGIDNLFYPLGSCTMKYNPRIHEEVASMKAFNGIHPLAPEQLCQSQLQIIYELEQDLSAVAGMDAFTMQPAAGAQGELTGIMLIQAYHQDRGDLKRKKFIIPDAAHGTNPASAALCGFETVTVPTCAQGGVDIDALKEVLNDEIAGLMLTNPNTLGLFDRNILEVSRLVHEAGGLLYYDGANFNAIMGKCQPGAMGFDVVHINLHKTFTTPHGGGGPGAGPVGVKERLIPYLPNPRIELKDGHYSFSEQLSTKSIGKVMAFYGNFLVYLRAYVYIKLLGSDGLTDVSENAVLNANYLMHKLKDDYSLPFDRSCAHEFVLSSKKQQEYGIHTKDIAKRLIDMGYHPPTTYFPLIVDEALMIEPTETECKETLDQFAEDMKQIALEAKESPEKILNAPLSTPVSKLDEVTAARKPKLRF